MREIQASDAKTHLPQLLDAVERGETVTITRHGRPIARLVPAAGEDRSRVLNALDGIRALRRKAKPMSVEEILAARDEGRR
jgi:prevent-host-death family protein